MHRNTESRICKAPISNILCYAGETWIMSKVEMTLAVIEQKIFNPWITKQKKKNLLLLRTGYILHPYFLNYFLNFFFKVQLTGSIEVNTLLLFRFLVFHAII